jgi:thiosulfate reductase cytochrome b subunit
MNNSKVLLYIVYGCLVVFVGSGLNLYFGNLTPREIKGGYYTMASVFLTGVVMLVMWRDSKESTGKR